MLYISPKISGIPFQIRMEDFQPGAFKIKLIISQSPLDEVNLYPTLIEVLDNVIHL